ADPLHLLRQAALLLRHPRYGRARARPHLEDRSLPPRVLPGRGARERRRRGNGGGGRPRRQTPPPGPVLASPPPPRHLLRTVLRLHRSHHHLRPERVHRRAPARHRGGRGHRAGSGARLFRAHAAIRVDALCAARAGGRRRDAVWRRPRPGDFVPAPGDHGPGARAPDAAKAMSLLEISGLTKRFGGLLAVSNFDLRVEAGEIVGLIGPNGAGKTTVFHLVAGFHAPTAGEIRFKDTSIVGAKPHAICRLGLT